MSFGRLHRGVRRRHLGPGEIVPDPRGAALLDDLKRPITLGRKLEDGSSTIRLTYSMGPQKEDSISSCCGPLCRNAIRSLGFSLSILPQGRCDSRMRNLAGGRLSRLVSAKL